MRTDPRRGWAGLDEEAESLERRRLASDLPQRYKNTESLRGACAQVDKLKLLGRQADAIAVLAHWTKPRPAETASTAI